MAGLAGHGSQLARELSGGTRRKLELAMSLVNVPAVLFLDEPTLSLAIGALFGAGITALSMALAFSLRSHSQFFPITGFASLPLTFASTALVPLALMPAWMRAVARLNPMTYAIDALRELLMTGWQLVPLVGTIGGLLAFDVCCVAAAAAAIRHGMR